MPSEDHILEDIRSRYLAKEVRASYLRLYSLDPDLDRTFAYFHQALNASFSFMNEKIRINRHYNAQDSRDLIELINDLSEVRRLLRRINRDFQLTHYYQETLDDCSQFLESSGGSAIPENFPRILVEEYETVFSLPEKQIVLPTTRSHAVEAIGEGAFSMVYKYQDSHYGFDIAIKKAKAVLGPKELERFRQEFALLKRLSFPYVLEVYRYDDRDNSFTMECCDSTLRQFVERENTNLSMAYRKRIALQFLYGLNYLHSQGVLHRDVSYNNILVKRYDYNAVVVKLSDFGLHKHPLSEMTSTDSDRKGTIVDPLLKSFREYSTANEIYPVGFVLNLIFSGNHSFGVADPDIQKILEKCINSRLENRYSTVREIINDIEILGVVGRRGTGKGAPA